SCATTSSRPTRSARTSWARSSCAASSVSSCQIIDERWREHLHDMDYLREGIHLRGFAQEDPLVAYKNEGFEMFTALMNSIWEEFARYIFRVEVEIEGGNGQAPG